MSNKRIVHSFIFILSIIGLFSCSSSSNFDDNKEEPVGLDSPPTAKDRSEKEDLTETDTAINPENEADLMDFYFSETPEFGSFSPLAYKKNTYEKTSPYIDTAKDRNNDQTKALAEYPSFQNKWVNELIKTVFFEGKSPEENADEFIESFEETYHEFLDDKDFGVSALMLPWEQIHDISVDYETAKFINLQLDFYSYSGGAHGMPALIYKVFDKTEKKTLALEDIIQKEKMSDFLKLSEQLFKKEKGFSKSQDLFKDYDFENNTFYLPDNFGMGKEGIVFVYNVYEIKSFADGIITFTVPYAYLKKFLTKKGSAIIYENHS